MNSSGFGRYPPCSSGSCTDYVCCAQGHKFRWPELLGVSSAVAKATIEKDNPFVTVVFIAPGRTGSSDFCCNRVYVIVDASDKVSRIPIVG